MGLSKLFLEYCIFSFLVEYLVLALRSRSYLLLDLTKPIIICLLHFKTVFSLNFSNVIRSWPNIILMITVE